jgi:hypothetical protein
MYRIRLASHEEAVYRTVEELAQAVSSGVVSADAEVFHKAGNRWLPINTHPDYRALVTGKRPALPDAPAACEPDTSAPASFRTPPARKAHSGRPAEEFAIPEFRAIEPANSDPLQESLPQAGRRVRARPGVWTAIGLGLAAAVVVVAAVFLPKRPEAVPPPAPAGAVQSEGMAPEPDTTQVALLDSAEASLRREVQPPPAPVARDSGFQGQASSSKPLAPSSLPGETPPNAHPGSRVISRASGTVRRMPSYFEAYADARAEMDEGLDYVAFRRVFAPVRFTSADSIRAARRMVSAAGNILRVYRGREVMLEQTYRPGDPDGVNSLRESFEASEASRSLLADADSLFGLLVAQQGEYALRGDIVAFQSRRAARDYSELRREILQSLRSWRDSTEAPNRVTMPRLLRAIGSTLPPAAR